MTDKQRKALANLCAKYQTKDSAALDGDAAEIAQRCGWPLDSNDRHRARLTLNPADRRT